MDKIGRAYTYNREGLRVKQSLVRMRSEHSMLSNSGNAIGVRTITKQFGIPATATPVKTPRTHHKKRNLSIYVFK